MNLREQENAASLEKHLKECAESNKKRLAEMDVLRMRDEELRIPKDLGFWERKRKQTQALRNKVLAMKMAEDVK
jgi:hypothetical protein